MQETDQIGVTVDFSESTRGLQTWCGTRVYLPSGEEIKDISKIELLEGCVNNLLCVTITIPVSKIVGSCTTA